MSKIELIQPTISAFNFAPIQLPELGSLKRTKSAKSDRVYLPSEPSKKIKSYFNPYNFSLENIENNSSSLNNSSLDSSAECTHENFENDNCKSQQNQQQTQSDSYPILNTHQLEENTPSNQNIYQEEECIQQMPIKLKSDIQFSPEGHCINYEDRNLSNVFSEENQNVSMIIGYLCLTFAAVFFIFTLFSIFFAPFLEPTTHKLVDFLSNDKFYCFLIPLSLPVMCLTIYMNWVSMKYFKHS